MKFEFDQGFTHGGMFHADDVFSTAFLKILNPDITVTRGNVVPENFDGIVFDIGLGKFDHHQKEKQVRRDGIAYASFGLLWKEYSHLILTAEQAAEFDHDFIEPLDLADNTGKLCMLSTMISDFYPDWEHPGDGNQEFWLAVDFAKKILERRFHVYKENEKATEWIKRKLDPNVAVLELDQYMPWKKALTGTNVVYVICPSNRGGYMVQGVTEDGKGNKLKLAFPEEWRGTSAEKLQEMTGISGFTFCHTTGFIAVADTLEDARKVAELSLKQK